MLKLTSKKMEDIIQTTTGKEVMYLGVFVDDNNTTIKPVKHGFATWVGDKFKVLSVPEKQIVESLNNL